MARISSSFVVRAFGSAVLRLSSAVLAFGCATSTRPPHAPPTPASVTASAPGGDAVEPHEAALMRLLGAKWGGRRDPARSVRFPVPDPRQWTGTEFALLDEFTAFRYGDDYHALSAVFIRDLPTRRVPSAEQCLRQHARWMYGVLDDFGVKLGEKSLTRARWHGRDVLVGTADAEVDYGFLESRVSAAWAAYPAYPGACLVAGIAVFHRGHARLAREVRDRWATEGVKKLRVATDSRPRPVGG